MKQFRFIGLGIFLAVVVFAVPLAASAQDPVVDEIQEIINLIKDYDKDDCIVGTGRGRSADKRVKIFSHILVAAKALIVIGDYENACDHLWSTYLKSDGSYPPRNPADFIEEGDGEFCEGGEVDEINALIDGVMMDLLCFE